MTEHERAQTRLAEPKKTCPDCGRSYIGHIGYHAERCTGTGTGLQRECECKPGWLHDPKCPEVAGYPEDAA